MLVCRRFSGGSVFRSPPLTNGSLNKGLTVALLDMLLYLLGLDNVYGSQQFTFGSYNVMDGIAYISLLIGLLVIPDIIEFYRKKALLNISSRDTNSVLKRLLQRR